MAHILWINLFAKNHFIVRYCLHENEIVCRRQKDYLLRRKKNRVHEIVIPMKGISWRIYNVGKSVCLEPLNRSGLVVLDRIHAQKAERLPFINMSDILIDYRSYYKTLQNLDLHYIWI